MHSVAYEEAKGLQKIVRIIAFKLFKVIPVAISDMVADTISNYYKIKRDNVTIAFNGVDCKRYACVREKKGTINLISVGNIYSVKNFSYLIDCFYEVSKKHKNVTLTIVGDGELKKDLETQIENLQIKDRVFLAGAVSDVENYLAKADIYVYQYQF